VEQRGFKNVNTTEDSSLAPSESCSSRRFIFTYARHMPKALSMLRKTWKVDVIYAGNCI